MKEKVAMYIINKRTKRLNPMRSDAQFAQSIENCTKIVISNVESDEPPQKAMR